jgi:hypothetical protein
LAGRFLELGLAAPDILESLHFYRTLGFTELAVGEVWPHKYAVVTDGALFIGLHENPVAAPVITLVQPSLRQHVLALQDAGTEFETTRLGEDEFNLAVLRDPDGLAVMLVEARTYSPAPETPPASLLGECLELALPVRDALAAAHFWAPLAPRLAAHREEPEPRFRLAVDGLVLGLGTRPALTRPLLVYRVADAASLQAAFDRLGVFPGPAADLPGESWGTIRSPEGADIALLKADYWAD